MSLITRLQTVLTEIATDWKNSEAARGPLASLTTTSKSSIVSAINEVKANADAAAASGGATNLDQLTDVVNTSPVAGHVLRHNGTTYVNVLGTSFYEVAGAAAAAQAASQPLDSDLTQIAALTTSSYGRSLLAIADQAALTTLLRLGTTTVTGILRLSTTAEAATGTAVDIATTPAAVKAVIDGRIDNNSALGSSTVNAPSQAAVKAYADGLLDANNAYQYKGVVDASASPNYPAASAGWTYKISVAGKIGGAAGVVVEVGDTITCLVDGSASGTQATVGANWIVMQTNIDGAVVGPASSTTGNIVIFSGTTGKTVSDSGMAVSTASISGNSATLIPTQSAVVAYAQPVDAELTALAGLTSAADRLPYFTGSGTAGLATFTSFGRTLVATVDNTAARSALSVYSTTEIGNPETDLLAIYTAAKA